MLALGPMSKIEDLARSLAEPPPSGRTRSETGDLPFERIARVMAAPMSRRRVLRLAAAAAGASFGASFFTLRVDRAYAGCRTCPTDPLGSNYPPEYTQFCGHPVGNFGACAYECCLPTDTCCDWGNAVLCCPQGTTCREQPVLGEDSCVCKNDCLGECCADGEECIIQDEEDGQAFCDPPCPEDSYRCFDYDGAKLANCCKRNEECCAGDGCCGAGQHCCGSDKDLSFQWCCPEDEGYTCGQHAGFECGCLGVQRCAGVCCPLGTICFGNGSCRGPGPENTVDLLNLLRRVLGAIGTDAAAFAIAGRPAGAEGRAAPGADDALVALGAVGKLAALAYDRFSLSRPDSAYERRVKVAKPKLAPIASGPGLDPAAARALDTLLSAEARAWALLNAAAVARSRSLGAIRAGKLGPAGAQARAFGHLAGAGAKALRRLPALRTAAVAALHSGGTTEVTVTTDQVRAFQASVRTSGLPTDVRARLAQLGLGRADQKRIAGIVASASPQGGPVLIAPIGDPTALAAIGKLARLLAKSAARSRRRPLVSSKGGPIKVRGVRPHASDSSRPRSRARSRG
jgi:hypothetical protein